MNRKKMVLTALSLGLVLASNLQAGVSRSRFLIGTVESFDVSQFELKEKKGKTYHFPRTVLDKDTKLVTGKTIRVFIAE